MPIFQIKDNKFIKIKEKTFDYEETLQTLVEKNLEDIFGLEFVSGKLNKQFILNNLELDTVAFDPQTKSFVIIEYKKDKSYSVIDQGYTYLSLLLNNKAEFILHYNEKKNSNLKKEEIDWGQSRVVFIAKEFTPYQKGAIGFKDLPIELWEVQLMENKLIVFNQIKSAEIKESITKVSRSSTVKEVSQEIKEVTFEDHEKKASPSIKSLLKKLRDKIFSFDENIKEKAVQNYLGYKQNWYNFVSVHVYQKKLRVYVRISSLKSDSQKRFKKVPESYNWGKTPLWWYDFTSDNELEYAMEIIKESYEAAPDK